MYKKILYPIKFEEFSLDLLSCALSFKDVGTKEIVLLYVIDVAKLPMDKYEGYSPEDVERFTGIAERKMEDAVKKIKEAGIIARKRIEVGLPYREILRVAQEEQVSLIASGRQKRGVMGEIFIGSNTDKIIRYGTLPVLIPKYPVSALDKEACRGFCERPFQRILYPTDWSHCADAALKYLMGLKDAGVEEVVISHVMDEKAMSLQPPEKLREFGEADMKKLDGVKRALEEAGFSARTRLRVGKAGKDLVEIAREEDVSLIVMGSHGKGFVEGFLWGSASRDVVEYSDRPVLLIKGSARLKGGCHRSASAPGFHESGTFPGNCAGKGEFHGCAPKTKSPKMK